MGRQPPGSSYPSADQDIQPTNETLAKEPDEPNRDGELNDEEGSSYCTAREATDTDQDLHTDDSKESTPTGEVLEDKEHTPTEEDQKERSPTENIQVEGHEERTPVEPAEAEEKLEGRPLPHQDVSETDREQRGHGSGEQEHQHAEISEPQEPKSAHEIDARESKQRGVALSKRELTDKSDHADMGAEMINAAMRTGGFISRLSLMLYPIISAIQCLLPGFLRRKLMKVMPWVIAHYRLSFTVIVLIFMTIFLCLPDTFLPEVDTVESARIAKNLYCNQSVVNDLVLKQFKSWKSAEKSDACEYIVCDYPSEIGTGLGQELPAINVGYLTGLASYACNLPKREVLLVWGAVGCGMETGLEYMIQQWREQGRVVINIDLRNFEGERANFLDFIHKATIDGFHGHELSSAAIQAMEELLNNGTDKSARSNDDGFMSLLKKLALKTVSMLPFVSYTFQQKLEGVFDSKLAALDSFLLSFVTGEEDAFSEINFQSFLSAINILVNYQPSLAPIVIFNQLDAVSFLGGSEGRTVIDDLLHTLEEHEQLENILPVIISSSNTLWIRKANILGLQSLFIPYEVAELGKENARKLLTEKLQIWTDDELNQIWNSLGGHYKSLEEVYKYHKFFGRSIEDAIHRVNEYTYTALSSSLSRLNISEMQEVHVRHKKETSVVNILKHLLVKEVQHTKESSVVDILKDVLVQDNQLAIEDTEDIPPAIESLLYSGVLYLDIDFKLRPTSKSMQQAIERYIQTL